MRPRVALLGIAGEYEVGFAETPSLLIRVAGTLAVAGCDIVNTGVVMHSADTVGQAVEALRRAEVDALCVCVGTWSEDHHLLDLLDHFPLPVILWAFPGVETGALCGAQQICCVLKELGREYSFLYGDADDVNAAGASVKFAKAAALRGKMRHVKIASIGGRVDGMSEIIFDEFEIKDKIGARIINLDTDTLLAAVTQVMEENARQVWTASKRAASLVASLDSHGLEAAKYYLAMRHIVGEYGLDGLCIKCYPKLMGKVCLGYSLLAEEGIVCGCEGDINNTVAMKLLYELTESPVHNTDLLYPDSAMNTVLFSHCGCGAFSIACNPESIRLGPARLVNTGVCTLFPSKPGKVTLVNLVGRKGTLRMSVLVGDALECGMEFPGNPLKVRFDQPVDAIIARIAGEGIGHHWMGGYGDVSLELKRFCELSGIRFIGL